MNALATCYGEVHAAPTLSSPRDEAHFSAIIDGLFGDFLVKTHRRHQMRLRYVRSNIGF